MPDRGGAPGARSGRQAEQCTCVLRRVCGDGLRTRSPQLGQRLGDARQLGGLVAPPAQPLGRNVGAVGLQDDGVQRQAPRQLTQARGARPGESAAEAQQEAQLDEFIGLLAAAAEGMGDALQAGKAAQVLEDEIVGAPAVANVLSGLVGGLPVTSVIVRSSANVNSGGRTRAAAFIHGLLLLLAVVFAGAALNRIPLAALASILLMTGYKLAKPSIFADMHALGMRHFVPFVITIVSIVATDLLRGIVIGIVVGIAFMIRESMRGAFEVLEEAEGVRRIRFLKDIHFFHKAALVDVLESLPEMTLVVVDKGAADFVEHDVLEAICEFRAAAETHGVQLELAGLEPVRTLGAH